MPDWTLVYSGTEKTLADWGISTPVLHRLSQAPDELTFLLDGKAADAASTFPYNAAITIYRNRTKLANGTWDPASGTIYFTGRRILEPRSGSASAESNRYTFVGPWADLDEYIYQQNWKVYATPPTGAAQQPRSHVFLNQDDTGAAKDTAWQIGDSVGYVRDRAVDNYGVGTEPLQLGAGTPAFNLPYDEQREITCAECIRKQLRWIPDAITWFDYSTSPPTLKVARRGSLTPVALDITAGNKIEGLEIIRRDDLTRPAVVLKFEQINEINGTGWTQITEQKAPGGATGTARGTLVATIQLAGYSLNTISATIITKPIQANSGASGTDATRLAWWRVRLPILNNARVVNLSITNVSIPNIGTRAFELTAGQMPPWIVGEALEETITARATYQVKDANTNIVKEVVDEEISVRITSTSVNTSSNPSTFSTILSYSTGETVPSGLADALYSALSTAQYQGRLTLVEKEITGTVLVGNVLNLTGGLAEWSTMNAMVQEVTEYLQEGRTEILFGPAGHLGVDDLVELLRVNRYRFNYTNPAARTQGQTNGSNVELGKQTPRENSTEGAEAMKRLVILLVDGANLTTIDLDATAKTFKMQGPAGYGSVTMQLTASGPTGTGGKDVVLQEVDICVGGVVKQGRALIYLPP